MTLKRAQGWPPCILKKPMVRAQLRFLMEMSLPALIYQNLTLDDRSQAAACRRARRYIQAD
jgi:hypothetical protein